MTERPTSSRHTNLTPGKPRRTLTVVAAGIAVAAALGAPLAATSASQAAPAKRSTPHGQSTAHAATKARVYAQGHLVEPGSIGGLGFAARLNRKEQAGQLRGNLAGGVVPESWAFATYYSKNPRSTRISRRTHPLLLEAVWLPGHAQAAQSEHDFLTGADGAISHAHAVPPGPLGGFAGCGHVIGSSATQCVWIDANSWGFMTQYFTTPQKLYHLLLAYRSRIEVPAP